jgi:ParB/RepB/Spo0J family partition protein
VPTPTPSEVDPAKEHPTPDEVGEMLDKIAPKEDASLDVDVDVYDTNRQKTQVPVLLSQIFVPDNRRPLDEAKIVELMESIRRNGLLQPIGVRRLEPPLHHRYVWQLVIGAHRHEAVRRLGWEDVWCTVIESQNPLYWELAEIDENLIRNNPSPAQEAILTGRRAEIIEQLGVSTQVVSKPAKGRPKEVASVRDQAQKTGKSREHVRRAKKRAKTLGKKTLDKISGTSLDKGVQLDRLAKLPEPERDALIACATAGEVVSVAPAEKVMAAKGQSENAACQVDEPGPLSPESDESADFRDALTLLINLPRRMATCAPPAALIKALDKVHEELAAYRPRRSESRPQRWSAAIDRARAAFEDLEGLREEYEEWRGNLPENLQDSALAQKLDDVIGLDFSAPDILDEAEGVDLPPWLRKGLIAFH